MNIKSLLLGSAAALIAVSGARAADAIVVAEPEPAEYVRICDVYGAGYYYIPGTETCLKVGGYLRYDIGIGSDGHENVLDRKDPGKWVDLTPNAAGNFRDPKRWRFDANTHDTYRKLMRAHIDLDARSETEYGTLRGYIALNFDQTTGTEASGRFLNPNVGLFPGGIGTPVSWAGGNYSTTESSWAIDHAIIQLGGLTIGYTDSLFESLTDSAGSVMRDGIVNYTPGKTHLIAYTFDAGNGFSATVGVEEGSEDDTIDSYVPHVVAGASFTQGWGKISGVVGYDSNVGDAAGKIRVDVNVNEALALFAMVGIQDKDAVGFYNTWHGSWAVWGGGEYRVNEKLAINTQLSYDSGIKVGTTRIGQTFAAVAGVKWTPVPQFDIRPEVHYSKDKGADGEWGARLRFQRSF